ncbi:hypothetical protein OsccyDRAFT_0635 [Leptolyngbyaceae cyanobacterium JSC-12]|nr:hypothetical protein OsccyDRAFT_0635 [Leptolyngbyaceae cyanobacterium JSC-12]
MNSKIRETPATADFSVSDSDSSPKGSQCGVTCEPLVRGCEPLVRGCEPLVRDNPDFYTRKNLSELLGGIHVNSVDNYLRKMSEVNWGGRIFRDANGYQPWVLDELRIYQKSCAPTVFVDGTLVTNTNRISFEQYKEQVERRIGTYVEPVEVEDEEDWLPVVSVSQAINDSSIPSSVEGFTAALRTFSSNTDQQLIMQGFEQGRQLGKRVREARIAGFELEIAAGSVELSNDRAKTQQETVAQAEKQVEKRVSAEKKRFKQRSS